MGKTIIFCADGTWNGPDDPSDGPAATTNVFHTYRNLAGEIDHGVRIDAVEQERTLVTESGKVAQIAKYIHGVGNDDNWLRHFLGGWIGAGLIQRIVRGYTFISRNYLAGDRIILIGFSRGAYTARALAGMIADKGLLDATRLDLEDRNAAYMMGLAVWYDYRRRANATGGVLGMLRQYTAAAVPSFTAPVTNRLIDHVPIEAVAVWDTVGSLGIPPYDSQGGAMDMFRFADTRLSPAVRVGIHAVALDERRGNFNPTLWDPDKRVTQVLFPGDHADVGGGHEPSERGLADISYAWMEKRLRLLDVKFAEERRYIPDAQSSRVVHDLSAAGKWRFLPHQPRQFPAHCRVKQDVLDRLADKALNPRYQPRYAHVFGTAGVLAEGILIEP
jgi:uncharacterized protein (DUF2235 family)